MIELKPLKEIMYKYRILLERYELVLDTFGIDDYKKLIGEVKLFWYRNRKYVDYFLDHITEEDEVAFLAGAVRLDIVNNGHFEYILVGKNRLINDPLLKMSSFYIGDEKDINFEYTNKYLKESIQDMLILFREYQDDFYILPIDFINVTEGDRFNFELSAFAERILFSMFSVKYENVQVFYEDNNSYEEIESKLLLNIRERLIFDDLKDINLSLREKCDKYLKANSSIMPLINKLSEAQLFYLIVSQFLIQAIGIIITMKTYHMTPFIRNDITFQYFTIIFHSNIINDFSERDFMNTYIPYVVQKAFDFSDKGYFIIREYMGNGKMINSIVSSYDEGKVPLPNDVVKCVEAYICCVV